jgi:hypothetical protein
MKAMEGKKGKEKTTGLKLINVNKQRKRKIGRKR